MKIKELKVKEKNIKANNEFHGNSTEEIMRVARKAGYSLFM